MNFGGTERARTGQNLLWFVIITIMLGIGGCLKMAHDEAADERDGTAVHSAI